MHNRLSDLPRRGRVDGRWLYAGVIAALLISAALMIARGYRDDDLIATIPSPRLIGATTTVTEVSTGLPFAARVDTGATTCSIHCEAVKSRTPRSGSDEKHRQAHPLPRQKQEWRIEMGGIENCRSRHGTYCREGRGPL